MEMIKSYIKGEMTLEIGKRRKRRDVIVGKEI